MNTNEFTMGPLQEKWLQALESDEYEQGTSSMCQKTSYGFVHCCLGVFCEVAEWERSEYKRELRDDREPGGIHEMIKVPPLQMYQVPGASHEDGRPLFVSTILDGDASDRLGFHSDCGGAFHIVDQRKRAIKCTRDVMERIWNKVPDFGRITEYCTASLTEDSLLRLTVLNDKRVPFKQIAALVRAEPGWFFYKSV